MLDSTDSRVSRRSRSGFALIEVLLVVALAALISAHAATPIAHTRRTASELRVLAALRVVYTAQMQQLSATGGFGYFHELELGNDFTRLADDVALRDGYVFEVWIADEQREGRTAAEDRARPGARLPYFCVLAWPISASDWRGRTVYALNESGQVAAMANQPASGVRTTAPPWHAAYLEPAMDAHPLAVSYVGSDGHPWELLP